MTPIPALTFMHSTIHSSQNCGVRHAWLTCTLLRGDHRTLLSLGRPSRWPPARRRQAIAERPAHHGDEVDRAHRNEGLRHPDVGWRGKMLHQNVGQGRADHGATAEAHDGHASGHAAPVRKPLDQGRDRGDVAQSQSAAADDPGAEPEQPDLVQVHAECRDHESAAPAEGGDDPGLSRSHPLEPGAEEGRRGAEKDEKEGEHPAELADLPVATPRGQELKETHAGVTRHRLSDPDGPAQRQPEHAEAVGHADGEMNGQRGGRHQPPIEARSGDDSLFGQQPRHRESPRLGFGLGFLAQGTGDSNPVPEHRDHDADFPRRK